MKITEIIVGAGRTFNHPFEQFSNLRPSVTLKAVLDDGDNPEQIIKDLQAKAESMVEDHKNNMLQSLRELHNLTLRQREIASLEKQLREAQTRLDEIRKEYPQITAEEVI